VNTPVTIRELAAVAAAFPLLGAFRGGGPYGSGHINDTFAVTFDQAGTPVRYILQRINRRIFTDVPALMDNIARVAAHVAGHADRSGSVDAIRQALRLVPARDGRPFQRDDAGEHWRCYLFIERARTYDVIETPAQAAEAAAAFGRFQSLLVDLPGPRLHETIPDFHHTRRRFDRLRQAIAADVHGRASVADDAIAFASERESMVDVLLRLLANGAIPERITHNDTKLNNVMLDDATGAGLCVIDLDTVMPGLALYDFGDMVRSATNPAAEDERDTARVKVRLDVFEALVGGYLATAGAFLTNEEIEHLSFAGRLITFEIGIRFLTDFLEGDVYFKTSRPGQNLDRARNQFALLHSMEREQARMAGIVERCAMACGR